MPYEQAININLGNYIYVGLLPATMINFGTFMGFKSNKIPFSFYNGDGNTNSYFALYSDLNTTSYSSYIYSSYDISINWVDSSKSDPVGSHMPLSYFYFAEMHQGGGGCYYQSNQFLNYYGIAIGLK